MGVQETRCPEICSLVDGIFWLGGELTRGHWEWSSYCCPLQVAPCCDCEGRPCGVECLSCCCTRAPGRSDRGGTTTLVDWVWPEASRVYWWRSPVRADWCQCSAGVSWWPSCWPFWLRCHQEHSLLAWLPGRLCLPCTFAVIRGQPHGPLRQAPLNIVLTLFAFLVLLPACQLSTIVVDFDLCNGDFDHNVAAVQLECENPEPERRLNDHYDYKDRRTGKDQFVKWRSMTFMEKCGCAPQHEPSGALGSHLSAGPDPQPFLDDVSGYAESGEPERVWRRCCDVWLRSPRGSGSPLQFSSTPWWLGISCRSSTLHAERVLDSDVDPSASTDSEFTQRLKMSDDDRKGL